MVMLLRIVLAVLATLMLAGFSFHAWRQRSFGVTCLALWMATLAVSAWALVFLIHPNGLLSPLGLLVTGALTMFAGPLMLAYVVYAIRGERLHWAWFTPALLYLAAVAALGFGVNLWFGTLRVMLVEFCYAAIAWIVWLRAAQPAVGQPAVLGVLVAVTSLHLGQVVGIADYLGWIDFRPIRQAPLIIVSIWLVVALVMALVDAPWLRRLAPGWTPPVSPADRELLERSDRVMTETRPWINPDFDIGALARLLDTYPNAISRALNRATSTPTACVKPGACSPSPASAASRSRRWAAWRASGHARLSSSCSGNTPGNRPPSTGPTARRLRSPANRVRLRTNGRFLPARGLCPARLVAKTPLTFVLDDGAGACA